MQLEDNFFKLLKKNGEVKDEKQKVFYADYDIIIH